MGVLIMNDGAKMVKNLSDLTKNIKGLNSLQLLTAGYTTTIIIVGALIHEAKMIGMKYKHEETMLQLTHAHEEKMTEIKANRLKESEVNEKDN